MRFLATFLVLFFVVCTGCSRQPSDTSMSRMSRGYFNSYGRKYKTTAFGLSKVTTAKVEGTQEWHKGLAEGEIALTHRDGTTSHVRCMFQLHSPFGWKIVSWENLH